MRKSKNFASIFPLLLAFLLGVSFLSGFFKKEVIWSYDCTPKSCYNGWNTIYHVWIGNSYGCNGPYNPTYYCSGGDTTCTGTSGTGYYVDSNCSTPAVPKGCCYGPTCTGCSCTPTCGGDYPLSSCDGPGCTSGDRCCDKKDSCGKLCGGQECKTCYVCTTPAAPATPTSVSLRVNTTDYNLSTNSVSPTIIDYRNGGTIKVFSNSTTTNYKYDVYNAYSGGTSLLDYSGTTQIQPTSGSLAYSPIGRFEARHYNFKCPDNSRNYSGTRIGYYCMERNVKPPTTPTGMNMTIDG